MSREIGAPTPQYPRITIVIPARNDARSLEVILPTLPPVHQVILVDGRSVDDTVETAARVMPGIEITHQTRRGKGNALACGFAAATGDLIVVFEADGSADAAEIPAFVAALINGADVAKGSRFRPGGGGEGITAFRRFGNAGLTFATALLLGTGYTDLGYGYGAFRIGVLQHLALPDVNLAERADGAMHRGDGAEIHTILDCRIAAAGLTITEVPSVAKRRINGTGNGSAVGDGLRTLKTIVDERRRARTKRRTPAMVARARPALAEGGGRSRRRSGSIRLPGHRELRSGSGILATALCRTAGPLAEQFAEQKDQRA